MDSISAQQLIVDTLNGNHFDYDAWEIIEVLKMLDDQYTNDGQGQLECSDDEFDAIRKIAQRLDPSNVYFTGIGSATRGGKVPLPYPMPSLNQVEVGELVSHIKTNSIQDLEATITDKQDGTSLLAIYNEDGLQICFSRGDGIEGADVTRHIRKVKNIPKTIDIDRLAIRCEVQLSEENFNFLQDKVMSRNGKPYKNSRNMIAGIMNAKINPEIVYEYIDVIAYSVKSDSGTLSDQSHHDQLNTLAAMGFTVPYCSVVRFGDMTDDYLAQYLNDRRKKTKYLIDGLVITINDSVQRRVLDGNPQDNPRVSFKYKVADVHNTHNATVEKVIWNISKHGYLKPTVVLHPFDLMGVTITHATGFNASFINHNKIGPGAVVQITRSGDVIPYIQHVIQPATHPALPDCEYTWTDTGIDILVTDKDTNIEVAIQQLIDFCASMDLPKLKEGNVRKLFEDGCMSCADIVRLSLPQAIQSLGAIGIDVFNGIQEKTSGLELYTLMGSVPFFGRGIGKRKMKKLISQLGADLTKWNTSDIVSCEGFDEKTAEAVMQGIPSMIQFLDEHGECFTFGEKADSSSGPLLGQKVCMTGFRDKEMERNIEDMGGEVVSGVSAKTTILVCVDTASNSGKAKKAREVTESGKGRVEIVSVSDFKERLAQYRA